MKNYYEWEKEQERKERESIVRIEVFRAGGNWIHTPVDADGLEAEDAIVTFTKCSVSYLREYFGVSVPVVRI